MLIGKTVQDVSIVHLLTSTSLHFSHLSGLNYMSTKILKVKLGPNTASRTDN